MKHKHDCGHWDSCHKPSHALAFNCRVQYSVWWGQELRRIRGQMLSKFLKLHHANLSD